MTTCISNSDDIVDSRDVIARIEELTEELEAKQEAVDSARALCEELEDDEDVDKDDKEDAATALEMAEEALKEWDEGEEGQELRELQELQSEAEGYAPDWSDGATLIRDDHFTDYVQNMLADIGDLPRDLPHYIVIDWEATASNIQQDYTSVEFGGVTYWVR